MKEKIVQFLKNRVSETSTIKDTILVLGALVGFQLTNSETDSILFIILALIGAFSIVLPDDLRIIFYKSIKENIEEENKDGLDSGANK